ncbi:MAG: hypothetical protein IJN95_05170 [Clostridia bacterium]|nr:hypothetical protein [Clostridia bacterium]
MVNTIRVLRKCCGFSIEEASALGLLKKREIKRLEKTFDKVKFGSFVSYIELLKGAANDD